MAPDRVYDEPASGGISSTVRFSQVGALLSKPRKVTSVNVGTRGVPTFQGLGVRVKRLGTRV